VVTYNNPVEELSLMNSAAR